MGENMLTPALGFDWGQEMNRLLTVVVIAAICPGGVFAQVEPEDLRPGLLASYRDNAQPKPMEVSQLDPCPALNLKTGESPHPRLNSAGGTYRWEGYLKVLRAGAYQFSANLRGKVRLTVAGKEVLAGEINAETGGLKEAPATKLEAGVHPLVVEFSRLPGNARLQIFWKSPFFHKEPLPYNLVGHLPDKLPAQVKRDRRIERGRFIVEERNCIQCHRPGEGEKIAQGLLHRPGPDLSKVGERTGPGWLVRWLEHPRKIYPAALMPEMFPDNVAGRTEIYAVTRYLTSLSGPLQLARGTKDPKSVQRGRQLFTSVGCAACHTPTKEKREPNTFVHEHAVFPLADLGRKTTPAKLAAYLQNPLVIDPSGRMPHMLLDAKEAADLAQFLCAGQEPDLALPEAPNEKLKVEAFQRVQARAEDLKTFLKLPADKQWLDLGKRLVIDKGCNNCHTIAPGGQPFANVLAETAFEDLRKDKKLLGGCLSPEPGQRGQAPRFALTDADRDAIRLFLREGTTGTNAPAPLHAARVALGRFNCLACHSRDGEGGLPSELVEELRKYEKVEFAEAVSPPPLTGIGGKLRTAWLRQVLTEAGRARPWMGMRMPQFGKDHVGKLADALAGLEGAAPDDAIHQVAFKPGSIATGRHLVGKSAFGCITCHDIAGNRASGTRGPDLALMNQRVRFDWYRRWLEQAQRMQPGTRMPTIFTDGQSSLPTVLGGNPDAQAEAIWAYLSLGPTLPLPEGVLLPKGLILTVKDRPVVIRTFLQDAGTKAIAVGYPSGVSAAFDATLCRLAYGWTGNFLDVSPVWNNRGGAPAKVLGPRFWTAPPGCPWGVSDGAQPPDFAAQAKNPEYGGPLPEGKVFTGVKRLFFEGYATDKDGLPTFRYSLSGGDGGRLEVRERPEPLRHAGAVGLKRSFTVHVPAKQTAWLLAGESSQPPSVLVEGKLVSAKDIKDIAAERPVILSTSGNHFLLLKASAPIASQWRLQQVEKRWQILLRVRSGNEGPDRVDLFVWSVSREDLALFQELLATK